MYVEGVLQHPRIVIVYAYGVTNMLCFHAMLKHHILQ